MLRKIIKILLLISIVLYFIKPAVENQFLKYNGVCMKAVLTNEKVGIRYHKSTLLYEFHINNIRYTGNSNIEDWSKVGDNICIVFLENIPSINAPIIFFKEPINCNCK